jgi:hypothetical protein
MHRRHWGRSPPVQPPRSSNPSTAVLASSHRQSAHTPTGHLPTEATCGPGEAGLLATTGLRASTGDASAAPTVPITTTANDKKTLIVLFKYMRDEKDRKRKRECRTE